MDSIVTLHASQIMGDLIDEIFPLEECSEVEDLPDSQTCERDDGKPSEVLNPLVSRC